MFFGEAMAVAAHGKIGAQVQQIEDLFQSIRPAMATILPGGDFRI